MSYIGKNIDALVMLIVFATIGMVLVFPEYALASDFKEGMEGIRDALSGTVLPLLSVIGILAASFSFLTGNPNAKTHALYALLGAGLGFGAQAIIDFIKNSVSSGL